jgi:thiamine pyrophosphate-dependent acetolactate synthase large subunit-like protein
VLADLIHEWSHALAGLYDDVPVPTALGDGGPGPWWAGPGTAGRSVEFARPDSGTTCTPAHLADAPRRVALLVGPGALADAPGVRAVAHQLGAPVANTWGAKGIYPWDSPHHMGTCGLQRDDFELLGLHGFDLVVAVGLDEAESRPRLPDGTDLRRFAGDLTSVRVRHGPRRLVPAGDNELFRRVSAIAQPGYVDGSVPRHPARAVMDLKQSLGSETRVVAPPGTAGLWVARTFPTDRLGSVVVPAYDRPGVAAAVALVSAARGTDTVCVVTDPVDPVTDELRTLVARHDLPVRFERWGDDVDWSRTEDLVAAAGPVVAWDP